ncbi:hypothetical protein JR316_0002567 [Psilocybe cubensis]|uniref:MYND-type domain-containing protein n=2 Tax=Psilocybe cubensis TaxID=181762 RepID=A0A8H7Y585_PSICU|nr:hypothetical protein JR316_0002567 [Psilocybe cubensis]KAH9485657.1 hypothetical protein JR316_0002567 [Psilocybe cubensis]
MSKELVESFNALPRRAKIPSKRTSNEWHFDVRYIQIEPNPSHVVYFLQPHSQLTHMERLPIGLATNQDGLDFFPETAKDSAPVLAKGILHAFVNNISKNDMHPNTSEPYAPWKLSTNDRSLATAVGNELKRLGVLPEALCNIVFCGDTHIRLAQEAFDRDFQRLKVARGLQGIVAAAIRTPECIGFSNYQVPPALRPVSSAAAALDAELTDEIRHMNHILQYIQVWQKGLPSEGGEYDSSKFGDVVYSEMEIIKARLEEKPESVINAAADRGDADAALDYGIRLTVGLGCKANRKRSREYLIKAAYSPNASPMVQQMAHAILIQWYMENVDGSIRSRYLFAASHHCNIAARLCTTLSPAQSPASPAILWFMSKTFHMMADRYPELYYWYKDAVRAFEAREKEVQQAREKMVKKRLKHTTRYRCAAPNCDIEADTGSKLSRCSGPCDEDKKPYYCSKECQREDWKNHKPFCRPGAECSIIDNGTKLDITSTAPINKSEDGALQVPITIPNGETVMLSSSSMDAKMLKEIQDLSLKRNIRHR